jgi:STE24 endopeptidase
MAFALLMGVALLRAGLYVRQLQCWAGTPGTPAGAVERLRWRMLSGLLQSLAACAALALLEAAAPRGTGAGLAALLALACLPAVVDAQVQALQAALRRPGAGGAGVASLLRGPALHAAAALVLAPLALGLYRLSPDWWWLGFVALLAPVADLVVDRYRHLAGRHRDGSVPTGAPVAARLNACLQRWGHGGVQLLFRQSASPQFNARAERSGRCGSIVLFDALVQQLPQAQLEAVMAHELGHLAGAHLPHRQLLLALAWSAVFGLASVLARGAVGTEPWRQLGAVLVLAPSLRFLLQPLVRCWLLRWELQADAFASRLVAPGELARTLSRLFELNGAPVASDPWFALFHESHPPLPVRLSRLVTH